MSRMAELSERDLELLDDIVREERADRIRRDKAEEEGPTATCDGCDLDWCECGMTPTTCGKGAKP